MPKLKRTPPGSPVNKTSDLTTTSDDNRKQTMPLNVLNKSMSETDLSQLTTKTSPSHISSRIKRKRDDEFTSELTEFKEEMKQMMISLFAQHKNEFKNIAPTLKEIQQTNLHIETSMAFLTAQIEEFKNKISQLESQVKEDKKYINLLEERIEDLQRDQRKGNFEIKNVPKKDREAKEDLIEIALSLSKSVGCTLNKNDIKDIYRIRGKKEGAQNTPIVVETSSSLLKTDILKASKMFNIRHKSKLCAKHLGLRKSEDTPIFISENLTPRGSRLHFLARDLAKTKSYKFCWTAYGRVYVRKDENSMIITIRNEAQIHQLLQDL